MTQKQELQILRDLLWKIGNYAASYKKSSQERLGDIISEIRYGYCYGQSNSYECDPKNASEKARIKSLLNLEKL